MPVYSRDTILSSIEHFEKALKYDRDDNHAFKSLRRLRAYLELLDAGANITDVGNGCVYIQSGEKTFRFYLISGKWSSKYNPTGEATRWVGCKAYRSKSPTDFVKKYVQDGEDNE